VAGPVAWARLAALAPARAQTALGGVLALLAAAFAWVGDPASRHKPSPEQLDPQYSRWSRAAAGVTPRLTPDEPYLDCSLHYVDLAMLPSARVASESWKNHGVIIEVASLSEAPALANALAAEHVALGLRAELLLDGAVREAEPEISPERRAALFFPDDAQVDPRALLRALGAACARAGVEVRVGALVTGLRLDGDVCRGVSLGPEGLAADAVVLAAGSWASLVPGVPLSLPKVTPARGQIVLLEERPPRTRRIVFHATGYVVPRGDGRVLCGSTLEHVGYIKDVTAKGVVDILGAACAAVPSLGAASVSDHWSNFRPYAEGGGPLVGASPVPGLFLATGHYRNGILLAHDTALRVASAVLG